MFALQIELFRRYNMYIKNQMYFCSNKIDIYMKNTVETIVSNWISQILSVISESSDVLFANNMEPSLAMG